MPDELDKLRGRLDKVDSRIIAALAQRQQVINEIARHKAGQPTPVRDALREQEVLTRLVEMGKQAALDEHFVARVYRQILDYSVRCQEEHLIQHHDPERAVRRTPHVGYLGIEGSYSHLAATKHFSPRGGDAVYRGCDSFREMLDAVQAGSLDCAVLPIENTTAGSINAGYDLLTRMNLALIGEEVLDVTHCLLTLGPVPLGELRSICSHPEALAQCSDFLAGLPSCRQESCRDTAYAARKVRADGNRLQAAIASADAGARYGLHVLQGDLSNQRDNQTRFVIVAAAPVSYDLRIRCKTSLVFATRHEQGALLACLNVLGRQGLNLTKLESRPRPGMPWEYLFYADFEGNVAEERVQAALRELATATSYLRLLGSYPVRVSPLGRGVRAEGNDPVPRAAGSAGPVLAPNGAPGGASAPAAEPPH